MTELLSLSDPSAAVGDTYRERRVGARYPSGKVSWIKNAATAQEVARLLPRFIAASAAPANLEGRLFHDSALGFPAARHNESMKIAEDGIMDGVPVLAGQEWYATQDTAANQPANWALFTAPPITSADFFSGERTITQPGHPFTPGKLQAATIEAGGILALASTTSAATLPEVDVIAVDANDIRVFGDWLYQPANGRTIGTILFLDDAGDWQEDLKDADFDTPRFSVFDGDWFIRQNWRPLATNAPTPLDNHVVRADGEAPSLRETNVYPAGSTPGAAPVPDAPGAWYEVILGTTAQHYFSRDGTTWELVQGPQDELVTEVPDVPSMIALADKMGQHAVVGTGTNRELWIQYKAATGTKSAWFWSGHITNPVTIDSTQTIDTTATIDAAG